MIHMRHTLSRLAIICAVVLLLPACAVTRFSDGNASGYRQMEREQCVPYARRASGIQIRGDAHTWWDKAAGVYARGRYPAPGAILVLSQTNRLRSGHLAVVTQLLGPRDINVTHTNWGDDWASRRIVYESMRAQDVSPANDWSSIRFWNREVDRFGSPYKAQGFIYNAPERVMMQPVQGMHTPMQPIR